MQRSIEQRQAPKRRSATRRTRPRKSSASRRGNGRSSMCWSATGCSPAPFFAVAKLLWHWMPTDWTLGDRIALVIKDAVYRHSAGACSPSASSPRSGSIRPCSSGAYGQTEFRGRHQQPVHSQHVRAVHPLFHRQCGVALYCPPEEARTLIILTALFLMGASCSGSAITTIPICAPSASASLSIRPSRSISGSILYMVFGIHVPISERAHLSRLLPMQHGSRPARRTSAR